MQQQSRASQGPGRTAGQMTSSFFVSDTAVILSRFFTRCPDLGGLVGDNVFDESA